MTYRKASRNIPDNSKTLLSFSLALLSRRPSHTALRPAVQPPARSRHGTPARGQHGVSLGTATSPAPQGPHQLSQCVPELASPRDSRRTCHMAGHAAPSLFPGGGKPETTAGSQSPGDHAAPPVCSRQRGAVSWTLSCYFNHFRLQCWQKEVHLTSSAAEHGLPLGFDSPIRGVHIPSLPR